MAYNYFLNRVIGDLSVILVILVVISGFILQGKFQPIRIECNENKNNNTSSFEESCGPIILEHGLIALTIGVSFIQIIVRVILLNRNVLLSFLSRYRVGFDCLPRPKQSNFHSLNWKMFGCCFIIQSIVFGLTLYYGSPDSIQQLLQEDSEWNWEFLFFYSAIGSDTILNFIAMIISLWLNYQMRNYVESNINSNQNTSSVEEGHQLPPEYEQAQPNVTQFSLDKTDGQQKSQLKVQTLEKCKDEI